MSPFTFKSALVIFTYKLHGYLTTGGHEIKFKSKILLYKKSAQANELGLINKICVPIWRSLSRIQGPKREREEKNLSL